LDIQRIINKTKIIVQLLILTNEGFNLSKKSIY